MEATAKINDGSIPLAGNAGTPASTGSSSEQVKYCAHRYHGCISQNGYLCLNPGMCQPVDSNGRRFVVFEWIEDGQRLATRQYLDDANGVPLIRGNKAVCSDRCMCQPENHPEGKGACGKKIAPIIVGS